MSTGGTKPGIRDVALEAGVSTATVSRVINQNGNVSQGTRERVLRVLKKSGFRPNAAAKALATNRTRTIAAIIPTLEHSIFAVFLNAIEDQLARAGYSLVIATHGFDQDTEVKRCNEVLKLGAEAIILSGAQHDPALLKLIKATGIPCVFTSVHKPHGKIPSFGYDNKSLCEQAIGFLGKLGHQNINVVHGPCDKNDRMNLRVQGAKNAQKKNKNLKIFFQEVSLDVAGGIAAVDNWIKQNKLPDACLCLADVLALGIVFEASKHRISIPEQFSLMGFEDLDWTARCTPALTTIALPAVEMGKATALALVDHLDNQTPLKHQLFTAEIIERDSTRASKS